MRNQRLNSAQLEQRIHRFIDRKLQEFPELRDPE